MTPKTTVLIVDDNAFMRSGLAGALDLEDDLEPIGEAANSEEALKLCRELNPDVISMDFRMPGKNGIECTKEILEENPNAKIILYSVYESEETIWQAVKAGTKGYLSKSASAVEDVMEAIHEVASGGSFFPASIVEKLESREKLEELSERELEVLRLLSQGLSNKEIADDLNITVSTVKHHIINIREKLNASDRTQAVVLAYKRGLLEIDT